MSRRLRRLGRSRLTPLVLAAVWLPYLTMRCISAPGLGGECNVLAALFGPAFQHHDHHATGHRPDASTRTAHDHCDKRQPSKRAHACCEATGRFNATISATEVSVQPVPLLAVLPVPVLPPPLGGSPVFDRFSAPVAHSPPVYLRHLTLLI